MYNNDMTLHESLNFYDRIWPNKKCDRCRYMWECIIHHQTIKDGR